MIGSLAACGSGDGGSGDGGSASKGSSGDTIKVGIVIPETGALAAFGAGTQEMTQYALDQIIITDITTAASLANLFFIFFTLL